MSEPTKERMVGIEQTISKRIYESIRNELIRMEAIIEVATKNGDNDARFRAIEVMASIKGKAELYCIQAEMAVETASAAKMLGDVLSRITPGADGKARQEKPMTDGSTGNGGFDANKVMGSLVSMLRSGQIPSQKQGGQQPPEVAAPVVEPTGKDI